MEQIRPVAPHFGITRLGNEQRGKKGAFEEAFQKETDEKGEPKPKPAAEALQPEPPPLRKDPPDGTDHVDIVV